MAARSDSATKRRRSPEETGVPAGVGTPIVAPAAVLNQEVEVKLTGALPALEAAFRSVPMPDGSSEPPGRNLVSTYYDTAKAALRAQDGFLRMLRVSGRYVITFKRSSNGSEGFARDEFEGRSRTAKLDISILGVEAETAIRSMIGDEPLIEQFTTHVRRRTHEVDLREARVEIALDGGTIIANGRREPVHELELELKDGDASAMFDFAARLARDHDLFIECRSKGDRGFALARDETPRARRSWTPALAGAAVLDDAVGIVLGECMDQFTGNWPAFRLTRSPDSIHQMRVGLRRMRTALSMFNRAMPSPQFQHFRKDAKRIQSAMSAARELDAFSGLVRSGPMQHHERDAQFDSVLKASDARREEHAAHILQLLDDPATTAFVLEFKSFLQTHGWRSGLEAGALDVLSGAAEAFALRTLRRLDARALKRGRKLPSKPPDERHEARIALKNLRYAADFFGALFDPHAVQKFVKTMGRVQDVLGTYNDGEAARAIVLDIGKVEGPGARAVGLIIGWCGRGEAEAERTLRDAWRSYRKADRFW